MSRIKDLYAEAENIDDLKPVFDKAFSDAVHEGDIRRIADNVASWSKNMKSEDFIADNAQFSLGDDDGQPCMYMENFPQLCDQIAQDNLDRMIEQEHLDLDDKEYATIMDRASAIIADYYSDYEDALCADEMADYNRDKKFLYQEERERHGRG